MMTRQRHFGQGQHSRGFQENRRPPSNESVLRSDKLQIERKQFILTLKENPRGKFLRITEDVGGRRDSIIIPATGLDEFVKLLGEVAMSCPTAPPEDQSGSPTDA